MLKQLIEQFKPSTLRQDALDKRARLENIFLKLRTHHKFFAQDQKLRFKHLHNIGKAPDSNQDNFDAQLGRDIEAQETSYYYVGEYVLGVELNNYKAIQLFRRGKVDSTQFAELQLLSLPEHIEYFNDPLFVDADLYQIDVLINHVIKANLSKSFIPDQLDS
jgi:hypothetical protein